MVGIDSLNLVYFVMSNDKCQDIVLKVYCYVLQRSSHAYGKHARMLGDLKMAKASLLKHQVHLLASYLLGGRTIEMLKVGLCRGFNNCHRYSPNFDDYFSTLNSHYLVGGSNLSRKLKTQIWKGEYIDLGLLLPKQEQSNALNVKYSDGYCPQLSLLPNKVRQPASFREWSYLFHIYMAVYLQRFPLSGVQMATYVNTIDSQQRRDKFKYVWRCYDVRKFKAENPETPWHLVNNDVLRDAEDMNERLASANKRPNPTLVITPAPREQTAPRARKSKNTVVLQWMMDNYPTRVSISRRIL